MNNQATTFPNREKLWHQLKQSPDKRWDVIVVGGGIIGAGVLREAIRLGLSALLIEQQDFAWGTSSRSSKMVHGGLRYIAQGDIKLTRQSVQERERLIKEAPGLIYRSDNYFLIKKWQFPGRFIMGLVLGLYDKLAGFKDHRFVNASQVSKHFSGINNKSLKGAFFYTDSGTDDARLVLRVLQESIQNGGQVLNYVKASQLIKTNGQVSGLILENLADDDKTKHESLNVNASVVINATGAWADSLCAEVAEKKQIRPLRGSHLIFSHQRLPIDGTLMILHPQDKRPVFIFPWEGATVVGTTDLDHDKDLNIEASITLQEIKYLFEVLLSNFPEKKLSREDVIASYAGVRPVMSSNKSKTPSKERRDHAVWSEKGLVTVSGGKLTTFRLTALDALKLAMPWLNNGALESNAGSVIDDRVFSKLDPQLLSGFSNNFDSSNHTNSSDDIDDSSHINHSVNFVKSGLYDKDSLNRIAGRYGNNAKKLLSDSIENERSLIEPTQFCLAECRWAAKYESVVHLDDLLLRRTRLGLLLKNGAEQLFPKLEKICYQELGWDKLKWQAEVYRYKTIWQQHYSLPNHE